MRFLPGLDLRLWRESWRNPPRARLFDISAPPAERPWSFPWDFREIVRQKGKLA
jgi:hypothetical protein